MIGALQEHWFMVQRNLEGLALDTYTERLGMKINTVISHLRANMQLGQAFRINFNHLLLTAGITEPILESRTQLPYIDNNWIMHLRQFFNESNIWRYKIYGFPKSRAVRILFP
jgi:hypothetical protein